MSEHPDDPLATDPFTARERVNINHGPKFETVLDLDELMTQGRRPERTARFCMHADLVADVESLDAELDELEHAERAAGEEPDDALASRRDELLAERESKREQMARAMRTVRLRAMPDPEWKAHEHKHRRNLSDGDQLPDAFWDEMVAACAVSPTLTLDDVRKLRSVLAQTQFDAIRLAAFGVNTATGVDIPKSRRSSADRTRVRRSSS